MFAVKGATVSLQTKPLEHESFNNRPERDARYLELKKTHANVYRYTDQVRTGDLGVMWWEMQYFVVYTP